MACIYGGFTFLSNSFFLFAYITNRKMEIASRFTRCKNWLAVKWPGHIFSTTLESLPIKQSIDLMLYCQLRLKCALYTFSKKVVTKKKLFDHRIICLLFFVSAPLSTSRISPEAFVNFIKCMWVSSTNNRFRWFFAALFFMKHLNISFDEAPFLLKLSTWS